jgi:hypothetical protein
MSGTKGLCSVRIIPFIHVLAYSFNKYLSYSKSIPNRALANDETMMNKVFALHEVKYSQGRERMKKI